MTFLISGKGKNSRQIAFSQTTGNSSGSAPGIFWLGGFKSDMQGRKASALADMANQLELGMTRFDYSGHGQSEGEFLDGTISDWLEDAGAAFEQTKGEQIIVGSSMGAWIAMLLNQKLQSTGDISTGDIKGRIKALILIAPAVDMTRDLMLPDFSEEELKELEEKGYASRPSDYDEPYILTKKLMDDGETHCLFGSPIQTNCPVYLLQGGQDKAVPTAHALKLVSHLMLDPVHFTLVPDGDHSLSRPEDLALLKTSIERALADGV